MCGFSYEKRAIDGGWYSLPLAGHNQPALYGILAAVCTWPGD